MVKYFFYSAEQLKLRVQLEKRRGKTFNVGHVIVNGTRKPFTELSTKDAKLVASGEISLMKYTLPEAK